MDNHPELTVEDTRSPWLPHSFFGFKNPTSFEMSSNSISPWLVDRDKFLVSYPSELCLLPSQRGHCPLTHGDREIRNPGIGAVSFVNQGFNSPRKLREEYHYLINGEDRHFTHKFMSLNRMAFYRDPVSDHHPLASLRKTKLCKKFERFGSCPYGERCNFAHGKSELKERKELGISSWSRLGTGIGAKKQKLKLEGKRHFTDWKIRNITQIYADWIDR